MTLPEMPAFADVFRLLSRDPDDPEDDGYQPHPWQSRLATKVAAGRWPDVIGVPTGAGKTATLDVALWALANQADMPASERTAPRRIVMVVDRRTIVDQAFVRAQAILRHLTSSSEPELVAMRTRLHHLMAADTDPSAGISDDPLHLALLRGGIPRDDNWARRPDQPLIAVSTVDQVGSRLLFRGYGVNDRTQSIHAGLLSHDTLFLLDEVHLARSFEKVLEALSTRYRHTGIVDVPSPWQMVTLSATSGRKDAFDLDATDRASAFLAQRLHAPKPTKLTVASSGTHDRSSKPARGWLKGLRTGVLARIEEGHRCVGVVVNRVDTASTLASGLRKRKGLEVQLVTGRMRPADRVEATARLQDRAGPGWKKRRADDDHPYICVATQTIEAGADLDFDSMVTELASLDALVQRFGRVNRTGAHDAAPIEVLAPKDYAATDPIYADARAPAWTWLEANGDEDGVTDASPDHLALLFREDPASVKAASAPEQMAAVLTADHLETLAQTSPTPRPSPEVDFFLHGLGRRRMEVTVLWRADLETPPTDDEPTLAQWVAAATPRLAAVPPANMEGLTLPLAAVRAWLLERDLPSYADVPEAPERDFTRSKRVVGLSWDGQTALVVRANQLRPDMTLILPAARGGIALRNFSPSSKGAVADRGDLARSVASGRVHLRLDPRIYATQRPDGPWVWPTSISPPPPPDGAMRSLTDVRREIRGWLDDVTVTTTTPGPSQDLQRLLILLRDVGRPVLTVLPKSHSDPAVLVLKSSARLTTTAVLQLASGQGTASGDATTAEPGQASSVSSRPVPLHRHLAGVGGWAGRFAAKCDLPKSLARDVQLAGEWHDLGKAHPRFQVLLHGGDDVLAASGELLAKSGRRLFDPAARRRAWETSGLPKGFRHEMVSVSLLEDSDAGRQLLARASDPDLVLHLVASHHGYARPFAPFEGLSADEETEGAVAVTHRNTALSCPSEHERDRIGSGVARRFRDVQDRYGWYTLAYLESILRLSDHRRSEEEERVSAAEDRADFTDPEPRQGSVATRNAEPPMFDLVLEGLDGANPLAFFAALGVLEALDQAARPEQAQPTLHWAQCGAWQPIVHSQYETVSELVAFLDEDRVASRQSEALHFYYDKKGKSVRDVKAPPGWLHNHLSGWRGDKAESEQHKVLRWFRGFVSEGVLDNNGAAKPTPLHFSAGQQQFLAMASDLGEHTTPADLLAALQGPWTYERDLPVMGWDATETRDYALRSSNPAKEKKLGNPGADWLALRALALFGTAAYRGRQQAPGTDGGWKSGSFTWPVWSPPLTRTEAESLLSHPAIMKPTTSPLKRHGIEAVFRSGIVRSDQGGYGSMLPAQPKP